MHGRLLRKEMLKATDWQKSRDVPVDFVDESGKVVHTVGAAVAKKDLPARPEEPPTLLERFEKKESRNQKPVSYTDFAWAGTISDKTRKKTTKSHSKQDDKKEDGAKSHSKQDDEKEDGAKKTDEEHWWSEERGSEEKKTDEEQWN